MPEPVRHCPVSHIKFSLIVATVGRSAELARLLDTLVRQGADGLEVIIVDQNADDRARRVIDGIAGRLEIVRIESAPGATRARNAGLRVARGDVIGFPDDDCWYPDGVLDRVAAFLEKGANWDGIIGHTVDADGDRTLPWRDAAGPLTAALSWRRSVTYVYFLRRAAVMAAGGFDETLGPGAGTPWGAGDDNEFMLRVLQAGARVYFDPGLRVHHPPLFPGFDAASIAKRASYARADGHVLRIHPMPLWWMMAFFAMPLLRLCLCLPGGNRQWLRFHWTTFRGRVRGFADPVTGSRAAGSVRSG